ncbi:hypothetical protein [Enterococcus phage MDA2]|uniref:Uncharacterized protein n=2 Tax=Kochikohdavirus TaxID=2560160 RepID=A0AAE7UVK8_9CAUD|nr:hypothetical protein [Enterococcus phage MDA2]
MFTCILFYYARLVEFKDHSFVGLWSMCLCFCCIPS